MRDFITKNTVSLLLFVLFAAWWSNDSAATPLIALREANNCGGCHKPGRSQRPFFERRCTLDCQGCHIDPTGGGARNQWGGYYSQAELPTIRFFEPKDPLADQSRFDVHGDTRGIQRRVGKKTRSFPMSSEGTVRIRPFVQYLHLTYAGVFFGRPDDKVFRRGDKDSDRRFTGKPSAMIDNLPLNTYVRAYRGTPMYGLKRSNHSLWIRERIGLDQFALSDSMEFGMTPNVPFFRGSYMKGDPREIASRRQVGSSAHMGLRGVTLGWHFNASMWDTQSEEYDINMKAVGGGTNIFGLILYGERNWRLVEGLGKKEKLAPHAMTFIHPSSEISEYTAALAPFRGIMFGGVFEKFDDASRDSTRRSLFIDLHPIPFLQFEFWRRFETGTRKLADNLFVSHVYFDF